MSYRSLSDIQSISFMWKSAFRFFLNLKSVEIEVDYFETQKIGKMRQL